MRTVTELAQHCVVLLTLQLFAFPRNASSDEYDNNLPNFQHPMVFGIGHVNALSAASETRRFFTVTTSSYISGSTHIVPFLSRRSFYTDQSYE